MWHGQDPLPDRHVRQRVADQVLSTFGHAPTATARTEAPPFTGERHEPFCLAFTTAEPLEAASEESTLQERPAKPTQGRTRVTCQHGLAARIDAASPFDVRGWLLLRSNGHGSAGIAHMGQLRGTG